MKRLVFTLLIGAFFGATAEHRISGPVVVRDTVEVKREIFPNKVSNQSAEWMARAIYSETKSREDMEYIGWVIRNRIEAPDYPETAEGVVLEPRQFSAFNSRTRRRALRAMEFPETKNTAFRQAYRTAHYVLSAPDSINPLPGATHFFMQNTMKKKYGVEAPDWAGAAQLAWATQQTKYYRMN